ncbi:MAG: hypothetical protein MR491_05550 [Mollicutes bacterium]|nr:hypothetical protein [Mollicutes bacterium]
MKKFNEILERPDNKFFAVDYSNPMREQFEEIPPYTRNNETGEILNDTPYPILRQKEDINFDDYINSFDDCDIYSLLKNLATSPSKMAEAGLKPSDCYDTTVLPKNIHEANANILKGQLARDNLDPRISAVIDDTEKLKSVIREILNEKNLKKEDKVNE